MGEDADGSESVNEGRPRPASMREDLERASVNGGAQTKGRPRPRTVHFPLCACGSFSVVRLKLVYRLPELIRRFDLYASH